MKESPAILQKTALGQPFGSIPIKGVFITLLIAAVLTSGALSWFASANPDGLEWSIANVTGEPELNAPEGIHSFFAEIQEKTAFLPDYNFKQPAEETKEATAAVNASTSEEPAAWPAVDSGTSMAGIMGSIMTLALAYAIGKGLQRFAR
jgi:cobalt/nickel transport system permease protein